MLIHQTGYKFNSVPSRGTRLLWQGIVANTIYKNYSTKDMM